MNQKSEMPTQKTLREILDKIILNAQEGSYNRTYEEYLDSAISDIKSLLKEKLPKEEKINPNISPCSQCGCRFNNLEVGFNQCLTEIKQILEAL